MTQAHLDLALAPETPPADAGDRTGFELGWDHARHGLVPAPGLLLDGTAVSQGWRAGKAVFGRRTLASSRPVRQWLALRIQAWREGIEFDGAQVGAPYLAQIETPHCPVTRRLLGGSAADAPVVERLNHDAGFAAGNLAVVGADAAATRGGLGAAALLRRAARIDAGIEPAGGALDPAAHWRLAVLASFATPLSFAEALRVPLRVLPPQRVYPLNAAQALQVLLTLQFATPGWSERLRRIAELLPAGLGRPDLRLDFNLFVGALAPRVLDAGAGATPRELRRALEDAWADPRVNQRWRQLALTLGEAGVQSLLQRAAGTGAGKAGTMAG